MESIIAIPTNGVNHEHSMRTVGLIDDLLGIILLFAAASFFGVLELTRRRICTIRHLAFIFASIQAFVIVGGLVDYHISNSQLTKALNRIQLSSDRTMYIILPVFLAGIITLGLVMQLSSCSCSCCCVVGAKWQRHSICFIAKLKSFGYLYIVSFVLLFGAIGTRLNVRLRQSAIKPVGGTLHWSLLISPFYIAIIHIGSCGLILLKIFLQHADPTLPHEQIDISANTRVLYQTHDQNFRDTTIDLAARRKRLSSASSSTSHITQSTECHALSTLMHGHTTTSSVSTNSSSHLLSPRSQSGISQKSSSQPSMQMRSEDGDVSSLISSDSESGEDILEPTFKNDKVQRNSSLRSQIRKTSGHTSPTSSTSSCSSIQSQSSSLNRAMPLLANRPAESVLSPTFSSNTTDIMHTSGLRERRAITSTSSIRSDSHWSRYIDPTTKCIYFYNSITGESHWEKRS